MNTTQQKTNPQHKRTPTAPLIITLLALIALALTSIQPTRAASLLQIENKSDTASVRIEIATDSPVEATAFTLENPPRLVVNIPGSAGGADLSAIIPQIPQDDPDLKGIRVGQFSTDTLRVVIDLSRLAAYKVEQLTPGPGVRITILRKIRETTEKTTVAPGIVYTYFIRNLDAGPLIYHTLEFNPANKRIKIDLAMAQDRLNATEPLSGIATRKGAVAAINGGYFDMASGAPIDMLIMDGKTLTKQTRNRGFLGLNKKNRPSFIKPKVDAFVKIGIRDPMPIKDLNRKPQNGWAVVFTPEYGPSTGTNETRREFIVSGGVITEISDYGNSPIPPDGFVISTDETHADLTADFAIGDKAKLIIKSDPEISGLQYGVTAGPLLLIDGQPVDPATEEFQATSPIVANRNPRTAVCETRKGKTMFIAVEGRSIFSVGSSIQELEALLLTLGCRQAINLDGGGSTEMFVNGQIMNALSDGRERPVANAFLIYYNN